MKHPAAWEGVLLALLAFRVTRLVGWDDLTVPIRRKLTGMSDAEHHEMARYVEDEQQKGNDPWRDFRRWEVAQFYVSKLVHCPWCGGFWISALVWAAWLAYPGETTWVAVPFAVSAVVGLVAKNLDP